MTAKECLEKYRHMDKLFSDYEWMHPPREKGNDSGELARMLNHYLYDLWAAVKDAAKEKP